MNLTAWVPTVVTVLTVVAAAAVADSSIKRHETSIKELTEKVQELETAVAVLNATRKGGA